MRPVVPSALAVLVFATALAAPAAAQPLHRPAPAPVPTLDLDRLQSVARHEGLPIAGLRLVGRYQLHLASAEPLTRAAFLKRASLLSYVVFKRLPSQVEAIEFMNRHGDGEQHCRIMRTNFEAYLRDAIPKVEYERRLAYREIHHPAVAALPPAAPRGLALPVSLVPVPPAPQVPELVAPPEPPRAGLPDLPTLVPLHPASAPELPKLPPVPAAHPPVTHLGPTTPAAPAGTMLALSYGLALGGVRYDEFQVEYGHPILTSLDLRPSVQIISPFTPINYLATGGTSRADGLAFGCDLLGTTRQHPGDTGLAFEGGIGTRLATMQGDGAGNWPALHLRVGLRWYGLTVGMRYPLLRRDGDPMGTWEATLGYSVPFSAFGGQ